MAISDKNTSFSIVLNKGIKHKLQIMAESEKRSLGNYISTILEIHIAKLENNILRHYGQDQFDEAYIDIFGKDFDPCIFDFDYDLLDEEYEIQLKINKIIRGKQRTTKANVSAFISERTKKLIKQDEEAYENERLRLKNLNNPDK